MIEFITGLRSRSKATSALIAGSFTPRQAPAGGESGRPPGIPAFGKGLLSVPRGGSRAVVVHGVHDPCFVLSSLSRMRARGCQGRAMAIFRVSIACWWVTDAVARWCLAMEGRTPLQSAVYVVSKFGRFGKLIFLSRHFC